MRITEQMCMLQTPQIILARAMCACDYFASVTVDRSVQHAFLGLNQVKVCNACPLQCNSMIVVYRACADSLRCTIAEGSIKPVEQVDCNMVQAEGFIKDQASNRLKLCISLFCHALRSQVRSALQALSNPK